MEHLFPTWMREYLREATARYHAHHIIRHPVTGKPAPTPHYRAVLDRPGATRDKRLRVVCKACNSGWMSILQNAAKPLLIPVMTGTWPASFSDDERKTVAAWATMASMVVDAGMPHLSGVTQAERTEFMQTLTPPNNWVIWMHWFEVPRTCHFDHRAYGLAIPDDVVQRASPGSALPINSQMTYFICGHAILQAFSTVATLSGRPIHQHFNPALSALVCSVLNSRQLLPLNDLAARWPQPAPPKIPERSINLLREVFTAARRRLFPDAANT